MLMHCCKVYTYLKNKNNVDLKIRNLPNQLIVTQKIIIIIYRSNN